MTDRPHKCMVCCWQENRRTRLQGANMHETTHRSVAKFFHKSQRMKRNNTWEVQQTHKHQSSGLWLSFPTVFDNFLETTQHNRPQLYLDWFQHKLSTVSARNIRFHISSFSKFQGNKLEPQNGWSFFRSGTLATLHQKKFYLMKRSTFSAVPLTEQA